MHAHRTHKNQDKHEFRVVALFPQEDSRDARKGQAEQIIQVAPIPAAVEEALPLRGQISLFIQENQIPGSAVVIVSPEHVIFPQEQIEEALRVPGQPLNGQVPASQMGLTGIAGAVVGIVEIGGVLLVPAALGLGIQAHQKVIAERGAAGGELPVHGALNGHIGGRGNEHIAQDNDQAAHPPPG